MRDGIHILEGRLRSRRFDAKTFGFLQPTDQPQADANFRLAFLICFERAIPVTSRDIDGSEDDAVTSRIGHQLRRCVEPHGLAVEQSRDEGWMVMTAKP